MPGAKEIVESHRSASRTQVQRAGGVHGELLFNPDRQRPDRRTCSGVAVVVAHDQRRSGREVEAGDVAIEVNEVACVRGVENGGNQIRSACVGGG